MFNLIVDPIKRYWYLILACALVVMVFSSFDRSPKYESWARLLYKLGGEYVQANSNGRVMGRIELNEAINSEAQILTSHDQLRRVVEQTGTEVYGIAEDRENYLEIAVAELRSMLNVRSVENSAVLQLTLTHPDPASAKRILETLIDVYLKQREKILVNDDIPVVHTAMTAASDAHEQARQALLDFRETHAKQELDSLLHALRDQQAILSREILNLERQLQENNNKKQILRAQIARQPIQRTVVEETQLDPAVRATQNRLAQLQIEEKVLLNTYTPESRTIANIRAEIEQIRRALSSTGAVSGQAAISRTRSNTVRDSMELDLADLDVNIAGAEARLQAAESQQRSILKEILSLESLQDEKQELESAATVAEERFRSLEDRYFEKSVLAGTASERHANVRVIESPTLPLNAVGMSRLARMFFGLIMGALLGWALAIWVNMVKHPESLKSLRRPRDYDDFGEVDINTDGDDLPVLGEFRHV